MTSATALRTAVIAELVLIPVSIAIGIWAEGFLPEEAVSLQESQGGYLVSEDATLPVLVGFIACAFVLLGLYLAAAICLLKLRRVGAWLYLIAWVVALPSYFWIGVTVVHPIQDILGSLFGLISGVILGVAFFSDAIPGKGNRPVESVG